ncbi:hypothetical protein [Bernardetia sp.]|uniref:hypothetical protein n=1 Tax=Bernardetia sp. TaxID=1937974 RepID=UPI0025BD57CE|nr:hypothetical protein [Bernardetia sp.]
MKTPLALKIENYEKPIKELIGKAILSVHYYEIDYGEPYWNSIDHHSIDYGLEIKTDDDETYYFIWDKQFVCYDLKFTKGKIQQEFSQNANVKIHRITHQNWNEVIGKKVVSIQSVWSYILDKDGTIYYPETIQLKFINNRNVWISAVEIGEGITPCMADHISVFFDEGTMNKHNINSENKL